MNYDFERHMWLRDGTQSPPEPAPPSPFAIWLQHFVASIHLWWKQYQARQREQEWVMREIQKERDDKYADHFCRARYGTFFDRREAILSRMVHKKFPDLTR
jgi:hypothetical protein